MATGYSLLFKSVTLAIFFTTGAFAAVLGNLIYNQEAENAHHVVKTFRKPWFEGTLMFLGMTLPIFNTNVVKKCKCAEYKPDGPARGWELYRRVAIPGLCDLLASLFQNFALLFLPPSIWQMLRGSMLIFTAIFAITYRKQKLTLVDWLGVGVTVAGIIIVGVSALFQDNKMSASKGMMILSMGLVLLGQALQAFQTIIEEELLHDVDATDSEVVAYEGLWGLYFSIFITLPLAQIVPETWGEGIYENTIESFIMMKNNWLLVVFVLAYVFSALGYNMTGMMVTSFSSAMHRTIYESIKSFAVWILSVIVNFIFPNTSAGEKLSMWSLLQMTGFGFCIVGTCIYNRIIKLPCIDKQKEYQAVELSDEDAPAEEEEQVETEEKHPEEL